MLPLIKIMSDKIMDLENIVVDKYCTLSLCEKTFASIVAREKGWIPEYKEYLFLIVYSKVLKKGSKCLTFKNNNPTLNLNKIYQLTSEKVKIHLNGLF